eukprot:TRINITY_DN19521_c0_g1_i3.p1 TRINITY_DN19521_c0_g1~~TRINITY_DN19521_c0_g1_i3.p1  ORF type:complete len:124 (-),score=17.28 TRINITY_DN19521_c0_g1_i3:21-392(-)
MCIRDREIHTHIHQYEHRSSIDAFTGMLSSPISMSSGRTDQPHYTGSTDCFSPISMGGGGMSPTTSGPPTVCLSLIHISEPTRLLSISYAVFCLKKKKKEKQKRIINRQLIKKTKDRKLEVTR